MSPQPETTAGPERRHQVVIIGSGFGGLNAAKKLKHANVDIKLIARTTHHLFQPLLYQVATGIVSEGDIAPPTRVVLRRQRNVQVLLGDVTHIDLAGQFVVSDLLGHTYETPYDSLIVAAGAGQSYFGNDHFAEFAPGMKSIDDALEVRGRILSAFEQAERSRDPERRAKLLTFTVIGAGPTGVEMAGQIAELAAHTLKGSFRHIDSTRARVILLDAAPAVLPPFGEKLGQRARRTAWRRWAWRSSWARWSPTSTATASRSRTPTAPSGASNRRARCGPPGVSGQRAGQRPRRAVGGRTRPGRPGQGAARSVDPGAPQRVRHRRHGRRRGRAGVAQGAIQGAKYVANTIKAELGGANPAEREPFQYFDKGSMATVSRFSAVAKVGPLEFSGFIAWLMWLVLHLVYLVGFKTKVSTLLSWTVTFLSTRRGQLTITEQQAFARTRLEQLAVLAAEAKRPATARRAS